jgi:aminoglycoside phosphotransferase (APT) family kinase protein
MAALEGSGVPVPRMRHYESDAAIIGTPFYVMEHVAGRQVADLRMQSLPKGRAARDGHSPRDDAGAPAQSRLAGARA